MNITINDLYVHKVLNQYGCFISFIMHIVKFFETTAGTPIISIISKAKKDWVEIGRKKQNPVDSDNYRLFGYAMVVLFEYIFENTPVSEQVFKTIDQIFLEYSIPSNIENDLASLKIHSPILCERICSIEHFLTSSNLDTVFRNMRIDSGLIAMIMITRLYRVEYFYCTNGSGMKLDISISKWIIQRLLNKKIMDNKCSKYKKKKTYEDCLKELQIWNGENPDGKVDDFLRKIAEQQTSKQVKSSKRVKSSKSKKREIQFISSSLEEDFSSDDSLPIEKKSSSFLRKEFLSDASLPFEGESSSYSSLSFEGESSTDALLPFEGESSTDALLPFEGESLTDASLPFEGESLTDASLPFEGVSSSDSLLFFEGESSSDSLLFFEGESSSSLEEEFLLDSSLHDDEKSFQMIHY